MMLLKLSNAAVPGAGDSAHPQVWLPAPDAWSREDLDQVVSRVQRGDCVHLTIAVPHRGFPAVVRRRRGPSKGESGVRDRLEEIARVVGLDASRVLVRIEPHPSAFSRWWETWARRRGTAGALHPAAGERRLDELLAQPERHLDDAYHDRTGSCEGRPHVLAPAASPLPWDVIDALHRWVSVGREAHVVLTVPQSPVSRDPGLHLLWERRMALDVADREGEVAQLWPGSALVRVDVIRTHPAARRSRRVRRSPGDAMTVRERRNGGAPPGGMAS